MGGPQPATHTACGELRIESLGEAEFSDLARALHAEHLPSERLKSDGRRFFSFRSADGERVGFAGLEIYDGDALLRSVVVIKRRRGRGCGEAIVSKTLDEAKTLGVRCVYLLTTGAAPFFARLGFAAIDRKDAPAAIVSTDEFTAQCPVTAELMMRRLG